MQMKCFLLPNLKEQQKSGRSHVDGMKTVVNRQYLTNYSSESTKTLQTESMWCCATANVKHLVVKVTH